MTPRAIAALKADGFEDHTDRPLTFGRGGLFFIFDPITGHF